MFTRIATVDVVIWDDTRTVPCDSHLEQLNMLQGLGVYLDVR